MSGGEMFRSMLEQASKLGQEERVKLYNEIVVATAEALLHDLPVDPATRPQLVHKSMLDANDYNPNKVASPELDLLKLSMVEDGITMPVVVSRLDERCVVADGFHRRFVATEVLGRTWVPCSVVKATSRASLMATTVRHNRARGKHDVELMGQLVRGMTELAWNDAQIAEALGMSIEEFLRLKQAVGAATILAAKEYARAWGGRDGADSPR